MPKDKGKKPKAISLVSAYESADESDADENVEGSQSQSGSQQTRSRSNSSSSGSERGSSRSRSSSRSGSRSDSRSSRSGSASSNSGSSARSRSQSSIGKQADRRRSGSKESPQATVTNEIDLTDESAHVNSKRASEIDHQETNDDDENPKKTFKQADESSKSPSTSDTNDYASKSTFTVENGFPAGCDSIRIPSAPKATCSQTLQRKIVQVLDRMQNYNYSINEDIKRKKNFKNPSIYEKLIEAYKIDEYGSSFPTHLEDLKANGYMFYDELDQEQRAEWAKREKEKKERTKIEMVSATKKK